MQRPSRSSNDVDEVVADGGGAGAGALATVPWDQRLGAGSAGRSRRLAAALSRFAPAIAAYLATRALIVVALEINDVVRHHGLLGQVIHWDGIWYSLLALTGYPDHAVAVQSTLGFFPLYPLVVRALAYPLAWGTGHGLAGAAGTAYANAHGMVWVITGHGLVWAIPIAGVIVSGIGGLIAAVLVQQLATDWWGERSGRRAAVYFCLFPGSVVFSMVYAEGLMLPLAAGCLLALSRRRWLLAGVLAALATATEPEAIVLVAVCAVSALREARRHGWRAQAAARSFAAPLLSGVGIGGFAVFLWIWTGTPLATAQAQHTAWGETTDGLALVHLVRNLAVQINFAHFNHPTIDLNLVVGLVGAIVLVALWALLLRSRRSVPAEAMVWTLGISALAVTSEFVPPNPRLLITAFPAIMVVGRYVKGRWYVALATVTGVLLVALSALTFVGSTMRP